MTMTFFNDTSRRRKIFRLKVWLIIASSVQYRWANDFRNNLFWISRIDKIIQIFDSPLPVSNIR